jgi:hypothetical protein
MVHRTCLPIGDDISRERAAIRGLEQNGLFVAWRDNLPFRSAPLYAS